MMPTYKSVNDEVTYYPTLGVEVAPGDTVDLPEAVDAAGLVAVESAPTTKTKAPAETPVEADPASDGASA